MRNGLKQGAAFALAAAVVAGGALLPGAASALQDRFLCTQTDTREIVQTQAAAQPSSILTTLAILADGNEGVLLRQGEKRTREQVLADAGDVLQELAASDLLPALDGPDEQADVRPVLTVSEFGGLASAIVWQINWTTAEKQACTMQIDDTTGKMVGVQIYNLPAGSTVPAPDPESGPQTAETRWLNFCRAYYAEEGFTLRMEASGSAVMELQMAQDSAIRTVGIRLMVTDVSVSFNRLCRFFVGSMPY